MFSDWLLGLIGSTTRQLAGDSRRFGGVKALAEAGFEKVFTEKGAARHPTRGTKIHLRLLLYVLTSRISPKELIMSSESLSQEASLLVQKEQWAQSMADLVRANRGIDSDTALASARWVCLWVDDFKALIEEKAPSGAQEVKAYIEASRASSLERSVGLPRYPGGALTVRGVIAAHDAFCLAFGDEADEVRQLLENQLV